jgi:hypothetical protein
MQTGAMAPMVECLLHRQGALSSNSSTTKKRQRERKVGGRERRIWGRERGDRDKGREMK